MVTWQGYALLAHSLCVFLKKEPLSTWLIVLAPGAGAQNPFCSRQDPPVRVSLLPTPPRHSDTPHRRKLLSPLTLSRGIKLPILLGTAQGRQGPAWDYEAFTSAVGSSITSELLRLSSLENSHWPPQCIAITFQKVLEHLAHVWVRLNISF